MATLTVKGIPRKLHLKLKQRASLNHRSLNSELIACLENSLVSKPLDIPALLEKAKQLREKVQGTLNSKDLAEFKSQGRL